MKLNIDFRDGKIIYNDFNINLNKPLEDQLLNLQEDLLQVKYDNNYVLDLGWYPELNPKGCFIIHIIKNSNWKMPIYQKKVDSCNLINELKNAIELIISFKGKSTSINNLLDE